ncbi:hypothetical protein EDB84DRAFT_1596779 [Lactarius hengduanensis]|nr:hypothetical protein EDB84DRAFT_1596779 [Lactarius hengduanensis]
MRPELDDVLECLSVNSYSVFSLIDDVLAEGCNQEDPRINICFCVAWALGFAQATMMTPLWNNNVVSPGLPGIAWTSMGGPERLLNMGKVLFKNFKYGVTIDVLPDNVLLEIFDFYLRDPTTICSYGTPVRQNLGSWPVTLPLAIDYSLSVSRLTSDDEDSLVYALRRASRVHRIDLRGQGPLLRKVAAVMRKSFPMLTHLDLTNTWDRRGAPVIPERFLGESAPSLQYLRLGRISFPQLPTFLLSARNLITLKVEDICQNCYMSPEDMVGGLAVVTRLRTLSITFNEDEFSPSPSDQRSRPDPPMRITLPALTAFHYQVTASTWRASWPKLIQPRVDDFRIEYLAHEIQATQLTRFLDRTELDQFNRTRLSARESAFYSGGHGPQTNRYMRKFPYFCCGKVAFVWRDCSVNCFCARRPRNSEEMVTNVFPELHLIWLDEMDNEAGGDKPVESIERFLAMRQLAGCPGNRRRHGRRVLSELGENLVLFAPLVIYKCSRA